ncbi:MAG: phosphatidylglycerol lysyltransferase domain-containing protein [Bacteroidales bacterium]|nr:phosphatidylglycerol lysyltransferase domain-containing protein [Bacteroidales bacterium]
MEEIIHFREVTPDDRSRIEKAFYDSPSGQQNHCFPVLYLYRDTYHTRIAFYKGFLLVQMRYLDRLCFFYPVGEGDLSEVIEAMISCAKASGMVFVMIKLTRDQKEELTSLFPGRFHYSLSRGDFEYIYQTKKLQNLTGKSLQSKRNHINALMKAYSWAYEDLCLENLPECIEFSSRWTRDMMNHRMKFSDSGNYDVIALNHALEEYFETGLLGGLIRLNGRVSAFSIGCPVGKSTLNVLFERADSSVRGLYPLICQQFAIHAGRNYLTINRGEDLNHEGLRKSKLSWKPDILLELYEVTQKYSI